MSIPEAICLVGCGQVYDTIAAEPDAYACGAQWSLRPVEGVAALAGSARALLEDLDAAATRLFVAVDAQALNFARLELYGVARMAGLRMATLVHPTAWVSPGSQLADNVWVGPGVRVAAGCRVDSDVMLMQGVRLDHGVHIGAHGWVGPGAALGTGVKVGTHSCIGADVQLRAGITVGRHCCIDHPGPLRHDLSDGCFLETEMSSMARIVGAGYSFQKMRGRH